MPFVGNQWDHAPPVVSVGTPPNGTDIVQTETQTPTLDTANATVSGVACPAGHTP